LAQVCVLRLYEGRIKALSRRYQGVIEALLGPYYCFIKALLGVLRFAGVELDDVDVSPCYDVSSCRMSCLNLYAAN
jgi:hypothetical protein